MTTFDQSALHEVPTEDNPSYKNSSSALDNLVDVIQLLSLARDLPTMMDIVRRAARRLVGADGATFVLRDGDYCQYIEEDSIDPLWKGQRHHMSACISGWVMSNHQSIVIDDVSTDSRVPTGVFKPTFVRSMAMVPIRARDPIGAIGNYWAYPHTPSLEDLRLLQALADATAVTMENIRIYEELEQRVSERTAELERVNTKLRQEIAERERVEAEVRQLSLTDDLTKLYNRRGFLLLADQQLRMARRSNLSCWLLFADMDGLKTVNDSGGHRAGDALISHAADVLRASFRDCDVVGRLGGDEFAIFVISAHESASDIRRRLNRNVDRLNQTQCNPYPLSLSLGAIHCDPQAETPLEILICQADDAMYEEKRTKQLNLKT